MTKFKNRTTFSSFRYALRGLALAVKSQKNFRTGLILAVIVILLAVYLNFSNIEFAILFIVINFILFAELVNTVIEFTIDTYFRNKYSLIAGMSKDIAAGTVLLAIINSVLVGLFIYVPKIIDKFNLLLKT